MKIFDSLCHIDPNIRGQDLEKKIQALKGNLVANGFTGATLLRMDSERSSLDRRFVQYCQKYKFIPAALVSPKKPLKKLRSEIKDLSALGYRIIKLHCRHDDFTLEHKNLPQLFRFAKENNLPIGLCTYVWSSNNFFGTERFLTHLSRLLEGNEDTKVILYHGGNIDLLKFAEFTRPRSNLLLDLSFTILKYEGSSIDLDIKFLFEKFDKRICVGSDFPDFRHDELMKRMKQLCQGVETKKVVRITSDNFLNFLGEVNEHKEVS